MALDPRVSPSKGNPKAKINSFSPNGTPMPSPTDPSVNPTIDPKLRHKRDPNRRPFKRASSSRNARNIVQGRKPQRSWMSTGKKLAIRAMLQHGMSEWQIAAMEGTSRSTVNAIRNDKRLDELNPALVATTKRMLSSRFYLLADKAVDRAGEDDRLEKMSSYQLAMIGAVSVDKARLMDGQSTENLAFKGVNEQVQTGLQDLERMKAMLLKRFHMQSIGDDIVPDGNASESND